MSWGPFFYPHVVRVRALRSGGGLGPTYDASHDVPAEVRDEQKLVRDTSGAEVVSTTQVTVPATQDVPLGSLVTVWPGLPQEREARVLAAALNPNEPPLDAYLLLSLE